MKQTNDKGYSFEIDESLTKYAHESRVNLKGLPDNIVVLKLTKEEEFIGYILFDTNNQTPMSEPLGIEQMGCKLDILKFIKYE